MSPTSPGSRKIWPLEKSSYERRWVNSTFSFKAYCTLIYLTLCLCCKRGLFRLLEHLGGKNPWGLSGTYKGSLRFVKRKSRNFWRVREAFTGHWPAALPSKNFRVRPFLQLYFIWHDTKKYSKLILQKLFSLTWSFWKTIRMVFISYFGLKSNKKLHNLTSFYQIIFRIQWGVPLINSCQCQGGLRLKKLWKDLPVL